MKANRIRPHSACGFKKKKGVRKDSKIWGLSKWENGGKMREIRGRMGFGEQGCKLQLKMPVLNR